MIEEITLIQVDESEQIVAKEECEEMQDQKLARQIEKFIEVTNMELEKELQCEDTTLILKEPQVIPQSPLPPVAEPTPREQGDVSLLDDDLVMDVCNLSFDEFQKRIV